MFTLNVSSPSYAVPTSAPSQVDATVLKPQPVKSSEDHKHAEDVVEFKEAGALAKVVVAVRTRFNESRRLVDIVA